MSRDFVDAHHHLWDLNVCHYPWLMAQGVRRFFGDPAPIQKNYLLDDFLSESPRWTPSASVHIQVGVQVSDSLKESRWLQGVADQGALGMPNAIVAFVDLADPAAEQALDQQLQVANVRGVRQIVGRHPDEDRQTGTDALISAPGFRHGLELLSSRGLSFDLQLIPEQYEAFHCLLSDFSELRVAICHCASPWYQDKQGLSYWRHWMSKFAELPNVSCKVSGLGMFDPQWTGESARPITDFIIQSFGTGRVLLGSNFPVDSLYGSYDRIWDAYDDLFNHLAPSEMENLFVNNARDFYRF